MAEQNFSSRPLDALTQCPIELPLVYDARQGGIGFIGQLSFLRRDSLDAVNLCQHRAGRKIKPCERFFADNSRADRVISNLRLSFEENHIEAGSSQPARGMQSRGPCPNYCNVPHSAHFTSARYLCVPG